MLRSIEHEVYMTHDSTATLDPSLSQLQSWAALGAGAALLVYGARHRSLAGLGLTIAGTPFLYRGLKGRWPELANRAEGRHDSDETRAYLAGDRGIHVRDAVQLEKPVAEVFRFWRRLENLPRFMEHLESVTEGVDGRSHWIARGPAGVRVEWDAEIINESENQVIGWRSLPGSDVVSAGSVNFDSIRGDRTQVTVHLQYDAPAGRAGALAAALLGRSPSQMIREDLRRFKQLLEAGEIARALPPSLTSGGAK
jgi:uncharacterized membrane protein